MHFFYFFGFVRAVLPQVFGMLFAGAGMLFFDKEEHVTEISKVVRINSGGNSSNGNNNNNSDDPPSSAST